MKKQKKSAIIIFLLIVISSIFNPTISNCSLPITPSTKVSILTCSPGYEVYSMYGHTAIRISDTSQNYDYVVNYGLFSMNIDNFAFLYVSGKTDYQVAVEHFDSFISEYESDNRSVYENILNIDTAEIRKIVDALEFDMRPENRVYRYKFYSNNCATRIRDVLERNLNIAWKTDNNNRIPFPKEAEFSYLIKDYWNKNTDYSFRQHIMEYQEKIPWLNAAIQIPIASPADTHMTFHEAMYSPDFLMDAIQNAKLIHHGDTLRFSNQAERILSIDISKMPKPFSWWAKPIAVMLYVFVLIFFITCWGIKKQRLFRILDILLLFITGIIGGLLIFMSFISVHECMFPNYNLIWAIPINIIAAIIAIFSKRFFLCYYKYISIVYIIFFITLPYIPQAIPFYLCFSPLIILVRYGAYKIIKSNKLK